MQPRSGSSWLYGLGTCNPSLADTSTNKWTTPRINAPRSSASVRRRTRGHVTPPRPSEDRTRAVPTSLPPLAIPTDTSNNKWTTPRIRPPRSSASIVRHQTQEHGASTRPVVPIRPVPPAPAARGELHPFMTMSEIREYFQLSGDGSSPERARPTSSIYSRTTNGGYVESPVETDSPGRHRSGSVTFSWTSGDDVDDLPQQTLYSRDTANREESTVEGARHPNLQHQQPWNPNPAHHAPNPWTYPLPSPRALATSTNPRPRPARERLLLLPSPPLPHQHLRTISLTQAQTASDAPGAVHLLPEELRAQARAERDAQRSCPAAMAALVRAGGREDMRREQRSASDPPKSMERDGPLIRTSSDSALRPEAEEGGGTSMLDRVSTLVSSRWRRRWRGKTGELPGFSRGGGDALSYDGKTASACSDHSMHPAPATPVEGCISVADTTTVRGAKVCSLPSRRRPDFAREASPRPRSSDSSESPHHSSSTNLRASETSPSTSLDTAHTFPSSPTSKPWSSLPSSLRRRQRLNDREADYLRAWALEQLHLEREGERQSPEMMIVNERPLARQTNDFEGPWIAPSTSPVSEPAVPQTPRPSQRQSYGPPRPAGSLHERPSPRVKGRTETHAARPVQITASPRPLDERSFDAESPIEKSRGASNALPPNARDGRNRRARLRATSDGVLAVFLKAREEKKQAERRRQQLRAAIRLVPKANGTLGGNGDRPELVERRTSGRF